MHVHGSLLILTLGMHATTLALPTPTEANGFAEIQIPKSDEFNTGKSLSDNVNCIDCQPEQLGSSVKHLVKRLTPEEEAAWKYPPRAGTPVPGRGVQQQGQLGLSSGQHGFSPAVHAQQPAGQQHLAPEQQGQPVDHLASAADHIKQQKFHLKQAEEYRKLSHSVPELKNAHQQNEKLHQNKAEEHRLQSEEHLKHLSAQQKEQAMSSGDSDSDSSDGNTIQTNHRFQEYAGLDVRVPGTGSTYSNQVRYPGAHYVDHNGNLVEGSDDYDEEYPRRDWPKTDQQ